MLAVYRARSRFIHLYRREPRSVVSCWHETLLMSATSGWLAAAIVSQAPLRFRSQGEDEFHSSSRPRRVNVASSSRVSFVFEFMRIVFRPRPRGSPFIYEMFSWPARISGRESALPCVTMKTNTNSCVRRLQSTLKLLYASH